MKMYATTIIVAAMLFVVPAFAATPEETAVIKTMDALSIATDEKDIEKVAAFYTEDAVIESTARGSKTIGKAEFIAEKAKSWATAKNTFNNIQVERLELKVVVKGDQAEVSRKFEVTVTGGPDRRQPWRGSYATEYKLRQEDGRWKIYFDKTVKEN